MNLKTAVQPPKRKERKGMRRVSRGGPITFP